MQVNYKEKEKNNYEPVTCFLPGTTFIGKITQSLLLLISDDVNNDINGLVCYCFKTGVILKFSRLVSYGRQVKINHDESNITYQEID